MPRGSSPQPGGRRVMRQQNDVFSDDTNGMTPGPKKSEVKKAPKMAQWRSEKPVINDSSKKLAQLRSKAIRLAAEEKAANERAAAEQAAADQKKIMIMRAQSVKLAAETRAAEEQAKSGQIVAFKSAQLRAERRAKPKTESLNTWNQNVLVPKSASPKVPAKRSYRQETRSLASPSWRNPVPKGSPKVVPKTPTPTMVREKTSKSVNPVKEKAVTKNVGAEIAAAGSFFVSAKATDTQAATEQIAELKEAALEIERKSILSLGLEATEEEKSAATADLARAAEMREEAAKLMDEYFKAEDGK